MLSKNPCIFCVQTEHQPNAKHIQAFQRFLRLRILVLFQNRIVQLAHQIAGFERNLHLFFQILVACVHKELQAIVFFRQILQEDLFRFAIRLVHVINQELREVAGDNPTRVLVHRQFNDVAFCLLKRIQKRTIRLFDCFA